MGLTKDVKGPFESMAARDSINLELFHQKSKEWKKYGCDAYRKILDVAEFVDYIDASVGKTFIEKTTELLAKLGVDSYDELACKVACKASWSPEEALEILEAALKATDDRGGPIKATDDYLIFEMYSKEHDI
jgi:hypothetical protein